LLTAAPQPTWCESVKGPLAKQSNQSGLSRFLNYAKGTLVECLCNVFTCLLSSLAQLTYHNKTFMFFRGRHTDSTICRIKYSL